MGRVAIDHPARSTPTPDPPGHDDTLGHYALPEHDVVVVAGTAAPRRRDDADAWRWYAPRGDLGSPMTLGRRWWGLSPEGDLVSDDAVNSLALRWRLVHEARVVAGPPAATWCPDPEPGALRAEALGQARRLAERHEARPTPAVLAALCRWWHQAELAVAVADDRALAWARDRLPDLAPTRAWVWELHRLTGSSALEH